MTTEQEDLCKEFVSRALEITNQEIVFQMRKRWEMDPVKQKEEADLHMTHQVAAWKIVKDIYCNNKQLIDDYGRSLPDTDHGKEIVESISNVIENEIEEILLD